MRVLTGDFAGLFAFPAQSVLPKRQRLAKRYFEKGLPGSSRAVASAKAFLKDAVASVFLTHAGIGSGDPRPVLAVISLELRPGFQLDFDALALLDSQIPYQCVYEVISGSMDERLVQTVTGLKSVAVDATGVWVLKGRVQTYYTSVPVAVGTERVSVSAVNTPREVHEAVVKALMPTDLVGSVGVAQTDGEADRPVEVSASAPTVAQVEQLVRERDELDQQLRSLEQQRKREKQPARQSKIRRQMMELKKKRDALD